ncbi:hypothetical protein GWE18_00290 [Bradyrhizobium sp. CSA112]|uniref:hypothetical protein n=1 Tax=Bradyrhizobium sp. CSA112 TaxID=2699170 RepID=UPI0023B19420|nr:hypothetical protein [Bradyrhizobium sp. CSA112]MDE5451315.1 hypothetical protein [Bradyrhizobium sp. CSA112]
MTGFVADSFEYISRRQQELRAEIDEAIKGSSAPVHIQHDSATGETLEYKIGDYAKSWPYVAADYDPA